MKWYVYKCNSRGERHQRHCGEWRDFFDDTAAGNSRHWGTPQTVPALSAVEHGDMILAYQMDRNSLMGLVEVDRWGDEQGTKYVYLRPLLRLGRDGVKVRAIKSDERIAEIHAFKTREVKTLYHIDPDDAKYILEAAKAHCDPVEFVTRR